MLKVRIYWAEDCEDSGGDKYHSPTYVNSIDDYYTHVHEREVDFAVPYKGTVGEFLNEECLYGIAKKLLEDEEYFGVKEAFAEIGSKFLAFNRDEPWDNVSDYGKRFAAEHMACISNACKYELESYVNDPSTSPIDGFDKELYDAYMHTVEKEWNK